MNQNMLLIALLVGALFFMRRPGAQAAQPFDFSYTGGAGTGYGVDRWGDEG
jgi:hypothetical protein